MNLNEISILFVHGYIQNGHIFETRMKNLTKKIAKKYSKVHFNFLFPDAPVVLPEQKVPGEVQRGWMTTNKLEKLFDYQTAQYDHLEESLKQLYEIGDNNQNIQMIFSFSQGAELTVFMVLLSLYKSGDYDIKKHFPNLKCIVFVAGFYEPFPENELFKGMKEEIEKDLKKCTIPSLHVYGLTDELLKCERSKSVLKFFSEYEEFPHPGRHFVPSTKPDVEKFEAFFEKHLDLL